VRDCGQPVDVEKMHPKMGSHQFFANKDARHVHPPGVKETGIDGKPTKI